MSGKIKILFFALAALWIILPVAAMAEQESEADELWALEQMEGYLDISEIEESLSELAVPDSFSFRDAVKKLLSGEIPFSRQSILETVSDLLLSEWKRQKNLALQILLVALASALVSNFVRIFENNQIADISFYMMYLMVSVLLLNSFTGLTQLVSNTCSALNTFMEILVPAYIITIVLSAGSVTALGFYEITLLAISLLQVAIIKIVLPAIRFYLMTLLLNELSGEDYFSGFAQLMETVINWTVKTVLGLVIGLQAVQCLVAPAVDSLKNSALTRLVSAIPGVGAVLDAAAETVAGSAVILKNAVGVAGILALLAICLAPLIRLAVCILLFRVLCAVIRPVCEKRMVGCIDSISKGTSILLRIMASAMAIFIISLAMITASVKGG